MDLEEGLSTAITALKVVVAVLLVLGVLVGILVATGILQTPTVDGIDREWGSVTNESTTIQATATVQNPNPIGLPGLLTVKFTAQMNDVVLTEGKRKGVGLSTGSNQVTLESEIPHDKIAAWWVTHVNNDERSTLTIDPAVSAPLFNKDLPNRTSKFETDLLSSLSSSSQRRLGLGERDFLVMKGQTASWGTATAETTPLEVSATIENVHDYDVSLAGVEYVVEMNGVTLGNGSTTEGVDLAPGETGTLAVNASLDTQKFADWWPTHVRGNETSQMRVRMYGIVEQDGRQKRVPLALYRKTLTFETDILGGGGTSVEAIPPEDSERIDPPTVEETTQQWVVTGDDATAIETAVSLSQGSEFSAFRDLIRVDTQRSVRINGETVAKTDTSDGRLDADGQFTTTTEIPNDRIPQWWVEHINNGESSTFAVASNATVDIGVTKFDLDTPTTQKTFSTDLLEPFRSSEQRPVVAANQRLLVFEDQSATWGTATEQRIPLQLSATLANVHEYNVTIDGVEYVVEMNDVEVGTGTTNDSLALTPGETGTLAVDATLDTQTLAEWWPTHVRSDERTQMNVRMYGIVEEDGERRRVPLTIYRQRLRIETDVLGEAGTTVQAVSAPDPEAGAIGSIEETVHEWGTVTEATTDVRTTYSLTEGNRSAELRESVAFRADRTIAINGITVADEESTLEELPADGTLVTTTPIDNGAVPSWWARHINNGESSTVRIDAGAVADVGITKLPLESATDQRSFTTNVLAGLDGTNGGPIAVDGRTVMRSGTTTAQWGTATADRTPLTVQTELTNEIRAPIRVSSIDYRVSLNGVLLADRTAPESYRIAPGETKAIDVSMVLDSSKMDQWWVAHIRDDERSPLDISATATVQFAGRTETVPLETLSSTSTVTTDILGGNESTARPQAVDDDDSQRTVTTPSYRPSSSSVSTLTGASRLWETATARNELTG